MLAAAITVPLAAPGTASACKWYLACADEVYDAGASAANDLGDFGDWVAGPLDEMLGGQGYWDAQREDNTEFDSMYIDGDGMRDQLFAFSASFLDCVSNFDPTGSLALAMFAAQISAGDTGGITGQSVDASSAALDYVEKHPAVIANQAARIAKVSGPLKLALATVTVKMAYDSCSGTIHFFDEQPGPAIPMPSTTTTTTTAPAEPTPGTGTSTSTATTSVPGGR
jgi:hypothetical protein